MVPPTRRSPRIWPAVMRTAGRTDSFPQTSRSLVRPQLLIRFHLLSYSKVTGTNDYTSEIS
jgi:hypothetical protein